MKNYVLLSILLVSATDLLSMEEPPEQRRSVTKEPKKKKRRDDAAAAQPLSPTADKDSDRKSYEPASVLDIE